MSTKLLSKPCSNCEVELYEKTENKVRFIYTYTWYEVCLGEDLKITKENTDT